jgi:hypothetical protein
MKYNPKKEVFLYDLKENNEAQSSAIMKKIMKRLVSNFHNATTNTPLLGKKVQVSNFTFLINFLYIQSKCVEMFDGFSRFI